MWVDIEPYPGYRGPDTAWRTGTGAPCEASQGGPMRLPIDTSRLQFLVVSEAERLLKFEEGKPRDSWAPRVDENGEVLSRVQVWRWVTAGRRSSGSRCRAIPESSRARWSASRG